MLINVYRASIRPWIGLIVTLLFSINTMFVAHAGGINPPGKSSTLLRSAPSKEPDRPVRPRPTSQLVKSKLDAQAKPLTTAANDPIRFTIASNKSTVAVNEPLELTIRAELLDISSSLMFFTDDAAAFRLKVLTPAGFVTTGGSFADLAGEKLSLRGKSTATYTLQGFFERTSVSMCFRVLRGGGQADNNSLFVEKATVCLNGTVLPSARLATTNKPAVTPRPITNSLTGPCKAVTKARYFARYDGWLQRLPGSGVQGSNDNQNWTTLGSITTAPAGGGWWDLNLTNSTAYRYLRWQAGPDSYGEIQELEFYAGADRLTGIPFYSNTPAFENQTAMYGPQNAFDGNTGTMWHTNNPGPTNFVGIDQDCDSGGIIPGSCYVVKNLQTNRAENTLQAMASNLVQSQLPVTNLASQIWKLESAPGGSYKMTVQSGNKDQVIYVDNLQNGSPLKVGAYTNDDRHQWSLAASAANAGTYRVYGGSSQNTWDQAGGGSGVDIQLYGTNTNTADADWDRPYRRFTFTATTCPIGTSLVVSTNNVSAPAGGTSTVIMVNSNVAWSVSGLPAWATATPASGNNNGSFALTVQANTGGSRNASFIVGGGGVSQLITVMQAGGVTSGNCYVITNLQPGALNTLQAMADNTVQHQAPVGGQANQIWKAQSDGTAYRFITQSGNATQVMYVSTLQSGYPLLVGPYANDDKYRWNLVASNNGGYRVYGGVNQNTWDHVGAGGNTPLQLYGNETNQTDPDWDKPYRRFSFTETTCPISSTASLAVNTNSVSAPASGNSTVIMVTSNVAWTVSGLPAWATASPTSGNNNGSFTLTVQANTSAARSASFTVGGNGASQNIIINQSGSGNDPFVDYNFTTKRWFGIRTYNNDLNAQGGVDPNEQYIWEKSVAQAHANYITGTVRWMYCEKVDGSDDFKLVESMLAIANALQRPLLLNFNTAVDKLKPEINNYAATYYIPDDQAMRDETGAIMIQSGRRVLSYNHPTARQRTGRWIQAQLNHIRNDSPNAKWLMGVSVTGEGNVEGEYSQNNEGISVLADYNESMRTGFITSLQAEFSSLDSAKEKFGTSWSVWNDVQLPVLPRVQAGGDQWVARTPLERRWANYREQVLADHINWWHDLVKAVSPKIKTQSEFGNVADNIAAGRGTMGVPARLRCDGVGNNSQPEYEVQMSVAVALRDRKPSYFAKDEIEGTDAKFSFDQHKNWIRRMYEGGATVVDWANYLYPGKGSNRADIDAAFVRVINVMAEIYPMLNNTEPVTATQVDMTVSLKELYKRSNWQDGQTGPSFQSEFMQKAVNYTKQVKVTVVNDLLSD
ncbi:BACON domain-containing protein [Fibrella sp. HMF5335]|uniref:BACON domain-containing protein n=1 Tax=Fibrella rubiginis TaxID=2817060 RepID=A0A939GEJ5_9BACT|nr:BACON domain-containing protein [Fibrella rubiginis]MBO0935102.1 BACON domain-containing protein [Fibrella rubiginis]